MRRLDQVIVKGKTEAVDVYELLEMHDGWGPPVIPEWVQIYEEGLKAYLVRDLSRAIEYFTKANALRSGGDNASGVMIERCHGIMREHAGEKLISAETIDSSPNKEKKPARLERPKPTE